MNIADKLKEYKEKQREMDNIWDDVASTLIEIATLLGTRRLYKVDGVSLLEFSTEHKFCHLELFYSDWNNTDCEQVIIPWEVISSDDPLAEAEKIVKATEEEERVKRAKKREIYTTQKEEAERTLYKRLKEKFEGSSGTT